METLSFCRGENLRLGHSKKLEVTSQPLSFAFPKSALTALVGANGAGKTTLLKAIAGEDVLLDGSIWLADEKRALNQLDPQTLAQTVAVVPQEHVFPADLLVIDLLRLAALPKVGIFGKLPARVDPEIVEIIAALNLSALALRPLRRLSTGERQRAFLARALLQHPKILVLDEPTNHLDPGGIFSFWNLLEEQRRKRQIEVIVTTHDLAFVQQFAQWVLAIKSGRVVYEGNSETFFKREIPTILYGQTL